MRILYLDCSSGIAGDMLLGALVDAGAERDFITIQLEALRLDGWSLRFEETNRAGLRATRAAVEVETESSRTYGEVRDLVDEASLDARVKARAQDAFALLAGAEATVHANNEPEIHFHEVGTTDALIDVIGSLAALESLSVQRVVSSPVAIGSGRVRAEHGDLPVPAPATLEILKSAGAPIYGGGEGELATPTGAALLATVVGEWRDIPQITPASVGHGAGSTDRSVPNVVRAIVGETGEPRDGGRVIVEANLDDLAPELLPHVVERLLEAGADDAWVTPIVMKKGRPAFTLSALVAPVAEPTIARTFFEETTTLGVRTTPVSKRALEREWVLVQVSGQPVQIKIARFEGRVTNMAPEYDDAVAAARSAGLSLREVYSQAVAAAQEQLRATP